MDFAAVGFDSVRGSGQLSLSGDSAWRFTGRFDNSSKMPPHYGFAERSMLRSIALLVVAAAALGAAAPARADSGPVIVIPSRPGVPVVINGLDASYAVVEGDWGLSRPGHGTITIIGGSPLLPNHVYHERGAYHPRYGRPPPRGRREIEPPADRALPEPPESFSRSWSTSSDPQPVYDAPRVTRSPERDLQYLPPDVDDGPATSHDPQSYNAPVIVLPRHRHRHEPPRGHRGRTSN